MTNLIYVKNETTGKTEWIDSNLIEDSGSIQHPVLEQQLINKIKKFHEVFLEVFPVSFEKTISNFQKDTHPEREVGIWEAMAEIYKSYTIEHLSLSLDKKKELFLILLDGSAASERPGGFKYFNRPDVLEITKRLESAFATIRAKGLGIE